MEVTKRLKPSISAPRIGDSAGVQAAMGVNAEQTAYGATGSELTGATQLSSTWPVIFEPAG